ncbi:MAG TPA: serine hydrolase domain-containing protein [Stenomitos sp.]
MCLPSPSGSPEQSEQVDKIMESLVSHPDEPGGAVIVIKEGAILHNKGYGVADIEQNKPITPQSVFQMASSGKQFTGLAIMMLAEAGQLDYDDAIATYLPELEPLGQNITIRHLLNHTSGLPGENSSNPEEELYQELLEYLEAPTNNDLLEVLSEWTEEDLANVPGECFDYSNVGYELLGCLIERVSGQRFGDVMEEYIFSPLGMKDTFSYQPERLKHPNRAKGYLVEEGEIELYDSDPLDNLAGSGSIYSTVEDLYRYDQALYTDDLVQQSTLEEAFKPAPMNDGSEYPYGFGWELDEYQGVSYVGHTGVWEGFRSYILRFPTQELSVYLLSNRSDANYEKLAFEIADVYLEDEE